MIVVNHFVKSHSYKLKKVESKSTFLFQGFIGLKSLSSGKIELNQLNAIKLFLRRNLKKKQARIWYRVFPEYYVTKKSLGNARMGKGKGNIDRMIVNVNSGQIILEINLKKNIPKLYLVNLLKQCEYKLNLKTKIIFVKK